MPHGYKYPQMPKEGVGSLRAGATGNSEPSHEDIGNPQRGFHQFCYTNICMWTKCEVCPLEKITEMVKGPLSSYLAEEMCTYYFACNSLTSEFMCDVEVLCMGQSSCGLNRPSEDSLYIWLLLILAWFFFCSLNYLFIGQWKGVQVCQNVHVEFRGEFVGIGALLSLLGTRDRTHVSLGGKHLYLLSHLTGPVNIIFVSYLIPSLNQSQV